MHGASRASVASAPPWPSIVPNINYINGADTHRSGHRRLLPPSTMHATPSLPPSRPTGAHRSLADLVKTAHSLRPHTVQYETLVDFIMQVSSPAYASMVDQVGIKYMRGFERRIDLLDSDSQLRHRLTHRQPCFPIVKRYRMSSST